MCWEKQSPLHPCTKIQNSMQNFKTLEMACLALLHYDRNCPSPSKNVCCSTFSNYWRHNSPTFNGKLGKCIGRTSLQFPTFVDESQPRDLNRKAMMNFIIIISDLNDHYHANTPQTKVSGIVSGKNRCYGRIQRTRLPEMTPAVNHMNTWSS